MKLSSLRLVAALGLTVAARPLPAQERAVTPTYEQRVVDALPGYRPEQVVTGTIRMWGHGSFSRPFMRRLVARWKAGFARFHPNCRIEEELYGTSSAIPALWLGIGDLAVLGEEILPEAVETFEQVKHYPPFGIDIATGSVDVRNFDYAQMFFVHRDNPLASLTLAQLEAIFGEEHRRGAANIRTWGQLGLKGEWADQPISLYGWRIDDSFGIFLEWALLEGSHRWNNALHEYSHLYRPDGTIYDHGQQALDALAADRYGIAVSNIRYAGPGVKPLAVAEREGAPAVVVTKESLISRTYPLTRVIPVYVDRPPGMPIEPKAKEFIRYLLSREGQQDIVNDGGYLPLNADAIAAELKKLR